MVRKESPYKSVADLKGKAISTGLPGYATTGIFESLLTAYGLKKEKEDVKWQFASAPDAVSMFKDRKIDLFAINQMPPTTTVQELSTQNKIRLLEIPDDIDKLAKENSG